MPPRRISTLLCGVAFFAIFLTIFTVPSSIPTGTSLSSIKEHTSNFHVPASLNPWTSKLNPFKTPVHAPPRQANDTYHGSSWYSDYMGLLMPFSSSVTLDENRSLLPPYQNRIPIYCYYDSTMTKDKEKKEAESELLLTWRRAWWAQGFKPVILSEAEAVNHPYYQRLRLVSTKQYEISPEMKNDVMRWLAFENMKGGVLAHHLVFPIAPYNDPLLSYLRRGEYPRLTRWENFGDALFAGGKEDVYKAVTELIDNSNLQANNDIIKALPEDAFAVEPSHSALAFYGPEVLALYDTIAEDTGADRIRKLNRLVNGHLHVAWQNTFLEKGINVLKPKPQHTSEMVAPALQLAQWLGLCPDTPAPQSCPPNMPRCTPCDPLKPLRIVTGNQYRDGASDQYTIATVPHPLTLGLLDGMRENLDIPYIRRKMERDQWLMEAIIEGSAHKLIKFKEGIAKDEYRGRSLWLEAEKGEPNSKSTSSLALALKEQVDIDWYFGFRVPRSATDPSTLHLEDDARLNGTPPSKEDREKEGDILKRARKMGKSKGEDDRRIRDAMEAWHMQDMEAWRFARAFRAREEMERGRFEEEESRYVDGVGSEKEERDRRAWL
ncbi:hypothetical protein MKZ38_009793 [Zalerion maritima]|uniref:Uncharacterized protein n=1 Tax=Zalerion maritima TaxID=339359 RepID=A0AAD5RZS7_9PEZI|nr:hypothetical protein MKZ38_009793 [Zalerion maritima]